MIKKIQGALLCCKLRECDKWLQRHSAFWKTFSYYWDDPPPPYCPPRGSRVEWHVISSDSQTEAASAGVLSSSLLMQPRDACQRTDTLKFKQAEDIYWMEINPLEWKYKNRNQTFDKVLSWIINFWGGIQVGMVLEVPLLILSMFSVPPSSPQFQS